MQFNKYAVALLCALAGSVYATPPAVITSWTTQTSVFPTGFQTQMGGSVILGDSLYILGGNNSTDGDNTRIWKMKINPYAGFIQQTDELTSMPPQQNGVAGYAYINDQTVTTGSAIYIAGGGWNTTTNNRDHATIVKINPGTGAVDSITTVAFLPTYDPELGGAAITAAGYFYAYGGDSQSGVPPLYDTVQVAQIQPNGDLGAFSTTLALPDPDGTGATGWWFPFSCTIGNYIIAAPGIHSALSNANSTNTVYVASTNPATGDITTWTLQSTVLPQAVYGAEFVAVEDTIFCIGGRTIGGTRLNVVYRATFDPNTGTVGAWQTVDAQLPCFTLYHNVNYSPLSKRLYLDNYRAYYPAGTNLGIQNAVLVSSPLYTPPVPPAATDKEWSLYE